MMIFIFSQFYGVSFGCKANADQRDLGIESIVPSFEENLIIPGGRPKPPVPKPYVCHFSEFYHPGDYIGGCKRENRRMKIVEDAVGSILKDFSDDIANILYTDVYEAQGMAV